MIVFDLQCSGAHVFEAWFGSTADFDGQRARKLIACPLCGDSQIEKAVMAPAVATKGNRGGELLAAQRKLEASADYVGSNFAVRARALHDGDEPPRNIYGEATIAEARDLVSDGIPTLPLPFLPRICSDA